MCEQSLLEEIAQIPEEDSRHCETLLDDTPEK